MTYPQNYPPQGYGQQPQAPQQQGWNPNGAPAMPGSLPFTQPDDSYGGYLNLDPKKIGQPGNQIGHLFLITSVVGIDRGVTDNLRGVIDVAHVDLVDLDDGEQTLREGVVIKHPHIVKRLRPGATMVLGRIVTVAGSGNNPAVVLQGFEPSDVPRAQAWVSEYERGMHRPAAAQPQQPAPVQSPQSPQGQYGAQGANPYAQAPQGYGAPQQAPQQGQGYPPAPQGYGAPQQAPQPQQAPAQQQPQAPQGLPPAPQGFPGAVDPNSPEVQAFLAALGPGAQVVQQSPGAQQ